MPQFIISALPGLLLGTIVGFGLARIGQGEGDEKARDARVAEICLAEARKMLAVSERSQRGAARPERPSNSEGRSDDSGDAVERAERTMTATLKRAAKAKTWSVGHGKMAERLLPRLPDETRVRFEKEILDAIEQGTFTAEAGAWLPKK